MVWTTSKVNDEGQDQKSNNRNDLDARKDELGFSIYLDGKDVQADNDYNDD